MYSAALELGARDAGVLLTTRLAVDGGGLNWEIMLRNDGMARIRRDFPEIGQLLES
ncbi:hypothetical protein ACNJYA_10755 [Bradyrhizobium sp. DASA03068]|uniref:hypothetical protein n=1 Tax=Bradyrhizobium sp. BLXBL-01 TaxID=3395915 RepID=UPI003F71D527